MAREPIAGPDSGPESPFPIKLNGRIVKGFGRGSSELGIPTANLPLSGLSIGGHDNIPSGVYYGWAALNMRGAVAASDAASAPAPDQTTDTSAQISAASAKSEQHNEEEQGEKGQQDEGGKGGKGGNGAKEEYEIYPTVLSIGYNPFYKNSVRSVEIHVMHKFERDFYNAMMNLSILGFIRPERDYDSMDALITDIKVDIDVADASLKREKYMLEKRDKWLGEWGWDR